MNEGIHLDLDTRIVPGQIRKANLCRGLGNRYTPAGTDRRPATIQVEVQGCLYDYRNVLILLMTVGGMGFIPERLLMMMMMMINTTTAIS